MNNNHTIQTTQLLPRTTTVFLCACVCANAAVANQLKHHLLRALVGDLLDESICRQNRNVKFESKFMLHPLLFNNTD